MTAKWMVYHGNNLIGEMNAAEIRDALRQGRIDPFDRVSTPNSSIKLEIIEVDEIFSLEPPAAQVSNGSSFSDNEGERTVMSEIKSNIQVESQRNITPAVVAPNRLDYKKLLPELHVENRHKEEIQSQIFAQDERNEEGIPQNDVHNLDQIERIKDKVNHLIDRNGRKLGPLSSAEIQSLFYRGVLDHSLYVQRIGSHQKVPVRQFLKAYAAQRIEQVRAMGEGMGPVNRRNGWNVSAVVNELHKGLATRQLAYNQRTMHYIFVIVIGAVFGLGLFFSGYLARNDGKSYQRTLRYEGGNSVEKGENSNQGGAIRSSVSGKVGKLTRSAKLTPKVNGKNATFKKEQFYADKEKTKRETPAKKVATNTMSSEHRSSAAPRAFKKQEEPKKTEIMRTEVENKGYHPSAQRTNKTQKVAKRAVRKSAAQIPIPTQPAHAAVPVASASSLRPSAQGGISELKSQNGKVVTTSQVMFNKQILEACPLKCSMKFQYGNGEAFTATFFKGAFYEQLSNSSGGVRLVGRVKGDGSSYTIFLQGVTN